MASLQGAVESSAPVSRLHEQQSYDPADFPVPTGARGVHRPDSAGKSDTGGGRFTVWQTTGDRHNAVSVGPPAAQAPGSLGRAQ